MVYVYSVVPNHEDKFLMGSNKMLRHYSLLTTMLVLRKMLTTLGFKKYQTNNEALQLSSLVDDLKLSGKTLSLKQTCTVFFGV